MRTEKTVKKSEKNTYSKGDIVEDCIVGETVKTKDPSGRYRYKYECECKICGTKKYKTGYELKNKNGVLHKSCNKSKRKFDKRFWGIYSDAKRRCNDKNRKDYENYGGKGVEFKLGEYEDFHTKLYASYKKHCDDFGVRNTSIDRIDAKGNYSYDNVKWATWKEQNNNKRNQLQINKRISDSKTKIHIDEFKPYFEDYIHGRKTVEELSQILHVSKATIRRKICELK